jgi:hypothetical protein
MATPGAALLSFFLLIGTFKAIAMMPFGVTVAAMGFATWQRRAVPMTAVRPDQEEAPAAAIPAGAAA